MNENYISMCREAKELQEQWEPKDGDQIIYNDGKHFDNGIGFVKHVWNAMKGEYNFQCIMKNEWLKPIDEYLIWLPRQEDLQEICENHLKGDLLYFFYNWGVNTTPRTPHNEQINMDNLNKFKYPSLNELWVAFTMEKVYNKTWNGTTWEVIK